MKQSNGFHALLATPEPAELGPGPRAGVRPEAELTREVEALGEQAGIRGQRRDLIRALVLLWHDHLDSAHSLAQAVDGADGALVHGIMHRREPDYRNAAYWFHRAGRHPSFPELARRVAALGGGDGEHKLLAELTSGGEWDAMAFIQACEQAARQPAGQQRVRLLREVQRLESETVLERFCS